MKSLSWDLLHFRNSSQLQLLSHGTAFKQNVEFSLETSCTVCCRWRHNLHQNEEHIYIFFSCSSNIGNMWRENIFLTVPFSPPFLHIFFFIFNFLSFSVHPSHTLSLSLSQTYIIHNRIQTYTSTWHNCTTIGQKVWECVWSNTMDVRANTQMYAHTYFFNIYIIFDRPNTLTACLWVCESVFFFVHVNNNHNNNNINTEDA